MSSGGQGNRNEKSQENVRTTEEHNQSLFCSCLVNASPLSCPMCHCWSTMFALLTVPLDFWHDRLLPFSLGGGGDEIAMSIYMVLGQTTIILFPLSKCCNVDLYILCYTTCLTWMVHTCLVTADMVFLVHTEIWFICTWNSITKAHLCVCISSVLYHYSKAALRQFDCAICNSRLSDRQVYVFWWPFLLLLLELKVWTVKQHDANVIVWPQQTWSFWYTLRSGSFVHGTVLPRLWLFGVWARMLGRKLWGRGVHIENSNGCATWVKQRGVCQLLVVIETVGKMQNPALGFIGSLLLHFRLDFH